mmetsp:Transcript_40273/g.65275  ORF Transcript_40273/g.65275 Transcript_40273/m.65275 type:complete len:289 (-) Transcript_40273:764-1630(-)
MGRSEKEPPPRRFLSSLNALREKMRRRRQDSRLLPSCRPPLDHTLRPMPRWRRILSSAASSLGRMRARAPPFRMRVPRLGFRVLPRVRLGFRFRNASGDRPVLRKILSIGGKVKQHFTTRLRGPKTPKIVPPINFHMRCRFVPTGNPIIDYVAPRTLLLSNLVMLAAVLLSRKRNLHTECLAVLFLMLSSMLLHLYKDFQWGFQKRKDTYEYLAYLDHIAVFYVVAVLWLYLADLSGWRKDVISAFAFIMICVGVSCDKEKKGQSSYRGNSMSHRADGGPPLHYTPIP